MQRAAPILVLVVVATILLGWRLLNRSNTSDDHASRDSAVSPRSAPVDDRPAGSASAALGATILQGYADTNLAPENDLTLMSRLMENSVLLLKSAAHRPLSANEDWAALLLGNNAAQERFLPEGHVALNTKGQLVDRWRTPLFVHALGGGRYELRSAGPDRRLWTADDLHRNSDGSFRRGTNLLSPSLLESAARPR